MDIIYFAYGSNLCLPRLRDRVPGVTALGRATLHGYELRWHKRSVDGSGKCNIVPYSNATAVIHGALFKIPKEEKPLLDRSEGLGNGYEEATVSVQSLHGAVSTTTYVAAATHIDDSLRPYSWYRDLVVSGAEEQGLPTEYVDSLRLVDTWMDNDSERTDQNTASLPCDGSV